MAQIPSLEEVVAPAKAWDAPGGGRARVVALCTGALAAAEKAALDRVLTAYLPGVRSANQLVLAMVMMLGATNVGKSTICNAFLGSIVLPVVPQSESAIPTAVEHVGREGPPVLTGLQDGARVVLERGAPAIYRRLQALSMEARADRSGEKATRMRQMDMCVEANIGFAARGSAAVPGVRFRLLDCAGVGEAGAGHLEEETAGAGARSDFVVFVLSYTDLANAEAFRRLAELLRERPDLTDRIIVVVNKVDQYRPAEDGAVRPADVPARVVRMLRAETGVDMPEGAVVCVAGRKALLARRFLAGDATASEKDELFAHGFGEQWAQAPAPELRAYAEQHSMGSGLPALEARLVETVVQNRALLLDAAAGRLRSGLTPIAEARRHEAEAEAAAAVDADAGSAGAPLLGWNLGCALRSAARHADLAAGVQVHAEAVTEAVRALLAGLRDPALALAARAALLAGPFGGAEAVADFDAARAAVEAQLAPLRDRAERPGQPPPSEAEARGAAGAAGEAASRFFEGAVARLVGAASLTFAGLVVSLAGASLPAHVADAAAAAAGCAAAAAAETEAKRWLAVVQRPEEYAAAVPAAETFRVPVEYDEVVPYTEYRVEEEQRGREVLDVRYEPAPQPPRGGGLGGLLVPFAPVVGALLPAALPAIGALGAIGAAVGGGSGGEAGAPGPGMIPVPFKRTMVENVQVLREVPRTRTETRVRYEEQTRPTLQLWAAQRLRGAAEVVDVAGHVVDGAALAEALRGPCAATRDDVLATLPDLFSSAAVAASVRHEAAAAALPALRSARAAAEEAEGAAREALAGARRERAAAEAELDALRGLLAALPAPHAGPAPAPAPAARTASTRCTPRPCLETALVGRLVAGGALCDVEAQETMARLHANGAFGAPRGPAHAPATPAA
eukprot:tig00001027_g6400.t1